MPWDSQYLGAVGTGPLGTPRPGLAERREMRQALRNQYGITACPTCQMGGGYAGDMEYGAPAMGGNAGFSSGSCPTCQNRGEMNPQYMGTAEFGYQGGPQPMASPNAPLPPAQHPMPTPAAPIAPAAPAPAAPSSSYYLPPAGMYQQAAPPVQSFNEYNPRPVQQTLYAP